MNKFNENDLLRDLIMGVNYDIDEDGYNVFLVKNEDVNVLLVEPEHINNTLWLSEFYNYSKFKGMARCTLYFILKQILQKYPHINNDTQIDIPMIEPNIQKNADMYSKMGFNIQKNKIDMFVSKKPLVTIEQLIRNLEIWCNKKRKLEKSGEGKSKKKRRPTKRKR